MGPAAVRIAAQDFLTPAEFEGLRLAERSAGQLGGARLELRAAGGAVRLGRCYQQVPVRVLPPFHFSGERAALLYLLSPTAGLLDGDGHLLDLVIGTGVRAVVTGQSATRIHPCLKGFSTQQWTIRAEGGAQVVVLPGPAIPFQGARYYQRVAIDLAAGARLIWGDVWLPGRYARAEQSERFQFDRLVQELEVRREGALVFRDRFCWKGPWGNDVASWHLGDALAAGSLFVTGPVHTGPAHPGGAFERVALPLASGDTCLRWCGAPAAVLADLVVTALGEAAAWEGGAGAGPWLLSGQNLAPNHWFTSPPRAPSGLAEER